MNRSYISNLFLFLILAGFVLLPACKEKKNDPVTYPPVTLYPVKESKTYIFANGSIVDSMIFKLTFDNHDRLLSQWSVKEDIILDFDYSLTGKINVIQSQKSSNIATYMTEYLLNASGSVNYRNLINRNGDFLQSSSYIYNSEGHKIKEYAHTAKDSSLIYYGSWNGPNLMHYEYPSGETIVDVVYTNIPDNRNLGFFQFQKNRSYHLIQKEIVKSRSGLQQRLLICASAAKM